MSGFRGVSKNIGPQFAYGIRFYFERFRFSFLTNFCAPFFKEILFFFCGVTPSKTLAAPQPLNIAFPLGNGGVLRSEEGEGFRKEGDGGAGEKKRKKGRAKSAQFPQEFKRFGRDKHPCFFGGFPCLFFSKDQGSKPEKP